MTSPSPKKYAPAAPVAPVDPWSVREADFPAAGSSVEQLRFLARYAILAPSVRNAQPWRFQVSEKRIGVYADLSRRQLIADRHGRDLYVSVGCALENLLVAAGHFGFRPEIDYFPLSRDDELAAQVSFSAARKTAPGRPSAQFKAITQRRTHHESYDGRPLTASQLNKLSSCCSEQGLALLLTQDASIRQAVGRMVLRADTLAIANPDYRRELADCIGAGGYGAPGLMARVEQIAIAHFGAEKLITERHQAELQSTPAFGLISADNAGREAEIKAGRVLVRLYLTVNALGLCMQPVSMLLEFDAVKAEFSKLFRAGGVPLVPFRLGYPGAPAKPTPRRPLEEVLY